MKQVDLTRLDYNSFVFPAVASTGPRKPQEFELAMKALDALRNESLAELQEVPEEEQKKAAEAGEFVSPVWTLKTPMATFQFEDAVADYIVVCIHSWAKSGQINLVAAEHALSVARKFQGA